jgi:menaquinone-9 beta-reductase
MIATSARYDAVVVGARCAGASTGMLLAQRGLRVLVADSGRYGTDTLSTHALMRGAVLQLGRWGILEKIEAAGTPAVRSASFYYGDEAIHVPVKPADGIEALYAPRRTLLDGLLVDAARAAGAEVLHETRLIELMRSPEGRVRGVVVLNSRGERQEIGAGVVIGADGLKSTVARLVEAEPRHFGRHSGTVIFAYWSGLGIEGYHWHFCLGTAAGAIPTDGGLTCVFAGVPERRFREEFGGDVAAGYHRLLDECAPGLGMALKQGRREGNFRGFAGRLGYIRQCAGKGWALVGDAGYFRDPIIAHGITDAFRDAVLLSRAVAEGTDTALAEYECGRDELSLNFFRTSDEIASFNWTFEELKEKHLALHKEMKREVEVLLQIGDSHPFPQFRARK